MGKTAVLTHACGNPITTTNLFRVSLAEDLIECPRLRYLVFNCELGEGLDSSASALLDRDHCDYICDHLIVQDAATGKLVGAYRMQSGYRPKGNLGDYGEQLFDFGPFEPFCGEMLELGSAAREIPRRAGVKDQACAGARLQVHGLEYWPDSATETVPGLSGNIGAFVWTAGD